MRCMPEWRGLQALVSQVIEEVIQRRHTTDLLEQQRREQREQITAQGGRFDPVEHLLYNLLSRPQQVASPPQTYAAALGSELLLSSRPQSF